MWGIRWWPGCAALRGFLDWVRDHSASTVIITSRAREEWLGEVRRIGVGGLDWAEAAQYAGYLLAPLPAARERRERRSFGELLDWLDGHPLAMRLILPRLDASDPAALLAGLRGTVVGLLTGIGGWMRLRAGTASPLPSRKTSATVPAWRSPITSSA